MKKLYALLLVFFILPTIFIFAGCEDKESRSIKDFYSNYLAISEHDDLLTKQAMPERFSSSNEEVVGFVYSSDLNSKISTIPAYSHINSLYNTMLDDAMGPMYLYGNMLSQAKISKDDTKYLYSKLDTLKSNYIEIAGRLGDLERNQNTSSIASGSLSKLYASYENAILTAIDISSKISSIYYNKIMINPNINYTTYNNSDINLEEVAIRTLNRLTYYKLVYVDIFLQTKILGYDVPNQIINGTFNSSYEPYEVTKNKLYSNTVKQDIENNREQIVELAKTLYNIQLHFEKEYSIYAQATKNITYSMVNEDSSVNDLAYKQIIDTFSAQSGIAYQSYLTVNKILTLCY